MDRIKVVVKVRPLIDREKSENLTSQWRVDGNSLHQLDRNGVENGTSFTFDKVYDENAKTIDVYNDIAKPIVQSATDGYNGTIFAYGQTSSGKTFTMSGTENSDGLIQMTVNDIFSIINSKEGREFLIRVSYLEIYNEKINDLLNVNNNNVKVHGFANEVRLDVTEQVTTSPQEVLDIMKKGNDNRQTGATNMNEKSSRSHTIFQIIIESRSHSSSSGVQVSQLNLVDLAGSERAGQMGTTGARFIEGTHINKSLSTLGLVIQQLSEEGRKQVHINYRDSNLTKILQNSLGGNAMTSIICAVTPASADVTLSTLKFANRAKAIKNAPRVNEVHTEATMIQKLTKQLTELKQQLASKETLEKKYIHLTEQISKLQNQIINGHDRPSQKQNTNRRKTWCAPNSMMQPIEEDTELKPHKFVTPAIKYNAFLYDKSTPIEKEIHMPCVSEEDGQITPPNRKSKASLSVISSEVIEIDGSDEESCSPYHYKCRNKNQTPPCVLREKAKKAEKDLQDIVQLTEREKIFVPDTEELLSRLDKNATALHKYEDHVKELNEKISKKESEITKLESEIKNTNTFTENLQEEKKNLQAKCDDLNTKLTDLEFAFETHKKIAKSREQDLLSLLEGQKPKVFGIPIKSPRSPEIHAETNDLNSKIKVLEAENSNLLFKLDDLQKIVQKQSQQIEIADNDIISYKDILKDLNKNLINKQTQLLDDSVLENMILNESKIIENNQNLYSIVNTMKSKIISCEQEIMELKSNNVEIEKTDHTSEITALLEKNDSKNEIITKLTNEISLAQTTAEGLTIRLSEFQVKYDEACTIIENNKDLNEKIENMMGLINELQETLHDKDIIISKETKNMDTLLTEIKKVTIKIQSIKKIYTNDRSNDIEDCSQLPFILSTAYDGLLSIETKMNELCSSNNLAEQNKELIGVIENLKLEYDSLKEAMNAEQRSNEELLSKNNQLSTEIENLSHKLAELNTTNKELLDEKETLRELVEIEQSNKISLETEKEELAREIISLKKDVILKTEQIDDQILKLNEMNIIVNRYNEKISLLEKLKGELEQEIKSVTLKSNEDYELLTNHCDKITSELNSASKICQENNVKENEISRLNNLLKEKDNSIKTEIEIMELASNKLINEKNLLQQSIECIADNIINLAKSHFDLNLIDQNIEMADLNPEILLDILNKLDIEIAGLKANSQTNNVDSKNGIEHQINDQCEPETQESLADQLSKSKEIIDKLNNDIKSKAENLEALLLNIKELDSRFKLYENETNTQIKELELKSSLLRQKCDLLETQLLNKNKDQVSEVESDKLDHTTHDAKSLFSMCCEKISIVMLETNDIETNLSTSAAAMCECNTLKIQLSNMEQEIKYLENRVSFFKSANQQLIQERENIIEEIQSLSEPAIELQKKVTNHLTYMSTLTGTTYAEHKLLKTQAMTLQHHLKRIHHSSQKELPEIKKLLVELLITLESDSTHHLKRYSLPIIKSEQSITTLKNESTLDGDLLMLDTTLAASNIVCDQACLDDTCTDFDCTSHNYHNSSLLAPKETSCLDTIAKDSVQMIQSLKSLKVQNEIFSTQLLDVQNTYKIKNTKTIPDCEKCLKNDDLNVQINALVREVDDLKIQKSNFESGYNKIFSEHEQLKSNIKSQIVEKENLITKLTADLESKKLELSQLQEENNSLSDQIIDSVSEVDSLKCQLDKITELNQSLTRKITDLEMVPKNNQNYNIDTSRSSKISSLQNELSASREDCRTLTENFATIKNHLDRSNMCLDDSMGEKFNIATQSMQANISRFDEKYIDQYERDHIDSLDYYIDVTGDNKENFDRHTKIVDVMKMLYNNMTTKHSQEIDNLNNNLKCLQESCLGLQSKVDLLTTENQESYHKYKTELMTRLVITKAVEKEVSVIDNMILTINYENYSGQVKSFVEKILKPIDSYLKINASDVLEKLIACIGHKHDSVLNNTKEQYQSLMQHLDKTSAEYLDLSKNMEQMKDQLAEKEVEYNKLKEAKARMHEISNVLTLDIVKKEQLINRDIISGYKDLIARKFLSSEDLDSSLSMNECVKRIFDIMSNEILNQAAIVKAKNSELDLCMKDLNETKDKINSYTEKIKDLESKYDELNKVKDVISSNYEQIITENKTNLESANTELEKLKFELNEKENILLSLNQELNIHKSNLDEINATELYAKITSLQNDKMQLQAITECLAKEKDECAKELGKAEKTIQELKITVHNINIQKEQIKSSNENLKSTLEEIKINSEKIANEKQSLETYVSELASKLTDATKLLEDKVQECAVLENNVKTVEKSSQIQSIIIKRLEKGKHDADAELTELKCKYEDLVKQHSTLKEELLSTQDEVENLQNLKNILENKVLDLDNELKQSKRNSLDVNGDNRRRRQSVHDSMRMFTDSGKHTEDHKKLEALFGGNNSDDMFMNVDEANSNKSTPIKCKSGRSSDASDNLSRPSSSCATRLRRQSAHDASRLSLHCITNKDIATQQQTSDQGSDKIDLELKVSALEQELSEVKERCRELDEECEQCAQAIDERDEQCMKLKKRNRELEAELTKLKTNQHYMNSSNVGKTFTDVAMNTDEDWSNLHSVVVDRMSFDAEVQKNKELSRAVQEFRLKNRELKITIAKCKQAMEKQALTNQQNNHTELEETKAELESCQQQLDEIKRKYKDLKQYYTKYEKHLRDKEEEMNHLNEIKQQLELRVHMLEMESSDMNQSVRKKRQSIHDQNRHINATSSDAYTDTKDLQIYQEELERNNQRVNLAQAQQIESLNMRVEKLTRQNAMLEHHMQVANAQMMQPQIQPVPMYVSTGSAIVQNQQLTDIMKENQKLKKINSKLVNICKKRGKSPAKENESPTNQS